jgi:hypothetical protein
MVFVFGSNPQGRHGKGAALTARLQYGAIYGQAEGRQGNAYGIITKELRPGYPAITVEQVKVGVDRFLDYARLNPGLTFKVTAIGCGLAGFKPSQIAPLFKGCPDNVHLPDGWKTSML